MKWWILISCLFLLTGCAAQPVWETVEDNVELVTQQANYDVLLPMPEQAEVIGTHNGDTLYQMGSMEVLTTMFYAADYQSAVKHLSGFEAENLNILQTSRFDMPEYQFVWCSQSEEGGMVYRADLLMDGMSCYAVVCGAPETDDTFQDGVRQVFSSFGLYAPEQV